MARRRRRLTRREKIFGWVGAVIFVAISVVAIRVTGVFSGLGAMAVVYGGWLGFLVAVWGFAVGAALGRMTDSARLPPVTGWPVTARKVPKSK